MFFLFICPRTQMQTRHICDINKHERSTRSWNRKNVEDPQLSAPDVKLQLTKSSHNAPRTERLPLTAFTHAAFYCASDLVQPNILPGTKFSSSNLKPELREVLIEFEVKITPLKGSPGSLFLSYYLMLSTLSVNHFCQPPFLPEPSQGYLSDLITLPARFFPIKVYLQNNLCCWKAKKNVSPFPPYLDRFDRSSPQQEHKLPFPQPPKTQHHANPPHTKILTSFAVQTPAYPTGLPKNEDWATRLGMKYSPALIRGSTKQAHTKTCVFSASSAKHSVGWLKDRKSRTHRLGDFASLLKVRQSKNPKTPAFPQIDHFVWRKKPESHRFLHRKTLVHLSASGPIGKGLPETLASSHETSRDNRKPIGC